MSFTFAIREPKEWDVEEADVLAAAGMHVAGDDDDKEDDEKLDEEKEDDEDDDDEDEEDRAEVIDELKELDRLEKEVQSETDMPIEIEIDE